MYNLFMQYALVNETKTKATAGVSGICPACGEHVFAKCGDIKVHHWAHTSNVSCDEWHDPETKWHREWKNKFPEEWQEIIISNQHTGKRRIADIRTGRGMVVEFQHSSIDCKVRSAREEFHGNMIWVVNGTRLKKDYPRFVQHYKKSFRSPSIAYYCKEKKSMVSTLPLSFDKMSFNTKAPAKVFPRTWIDSSVPVYFDFQNSTDNEDKTLCDTLWCLMPKTEKKNRKVLGIKRDEFVYNITKDSLDLEKQHNDGESTTPVQICSHWQTGQLFWEF